jgi:uncharacterized membrane protein
MMMAPRITRALKSVVALAALIVAFAGAPAGASSTATSVTLDLVARAGSSDVVYVVATCGQNDCLRMYRSNIQGSSFTAVTLPQKVVWGEASTRMLNSVTFATPEDGYALVGPYDHSAVYVTTNGAQSWHQVTSLDDVVGGMHVATNEIFAMTAQCSIATSNCHNYRVWRSTFTANKWTALPELWKAGTNGRDYSYPPDVAAFGADVWELEAANNGANYLWTSTDRGGTFSRVTMKSSELVSVSGCSLTPMSTRTLWAECPTGMQVSFWHSTDGGTQWSAVGDPAYQFMGTGGGAFDPITANVAFLDYGATTRHPNLFQVRDGGAREVPVGELSCNNASPLIFANAADGLVLCGRVTASGIQLLRTSNGGVTWNAVTLPRE